MDELKRIERLERLYEKLYHTYGMLSIYIPKMCDFWEEYLKTSKEYRYELEQDINQIRDLVKIIDSDMQSHYKSHTNKKRIYNKYISI